MRSIVTAPMVKGEMSTRLTAALDEPYLRFCVPCDAIHSYEQPFRLSALRAGLELQPGTSPPVLQPIPGFAPATTVPERLDVVRAYLRLLGPATPKLVAGYLDAPVKDVQARWPEDAVEVDVDGERALARWPATPTGCSTTRRRAPGCSGPFDLFLQARDRPLLVADPARREGPVAHARPPRRRARRRRDRRHLAGRARPASRVTVAVELWARPRGHGRRSASRPSGSPPSAELTLKRPSRSPP